MGKQVAASRAQAHVEPGAASPSRSHPTVDRQLQALHGSIGNRALGGLLARLPVASASAPEERHADDAALRATARSLPPRREGGPSHIEAQELADAARDGGQPLGDSIRRELEPAVGASVQGVRVHTSAAAAELAARLRAGAFTVGRDLFFARDRFAPHHPAGKALLAHELAHVARGGGTAVRCGPEEPGYDSPFGKAWEFKAPAWQSKGRVSWSWKITLERNAAKIAAEDKEGLIQSSLRLGKLKRQIQRKGGETSSAVAFKALEGNLDLVPAEGVPGLEHIKVRFRGSVLEAKSKSNGADADLDLAKVSFIVEANATKIVADALEAIGALEVAEQLRSLYSVKIAIEGELKLAPEDLRRLRRARRHLRAAKRTSGELAENTRALERLEADGRAAQRRVDDATGAVGREKQWIAETEGWVAEDSAEIERQRRPAVEKQRAFEREQQREAKRKLERERLQQRVADREAELKRKKPGSGKQKGAKRKLKRARADLGRHDQRVAKARAEFRGKQWPEVDQRALQDAETRLAQNQEEVRNAKKRLGELEDQLEHAKRDHTATRRSADAAREKGRKLASRTKGHLDEADAALRELKSKEAKAFGKSLRARTRNILGTATEALGVYGDLIEIIELMQTIENLHTAATEGAKLQIEGEGSGRSQTDEGGAGQGGDATGRAAEGNAGEGTGIEIQESLEGVAPLEVEGPVEQHEGTAEQAGSAKPTGDVELSGRNEAEPSDTVSEVQGEARMEGAQETTGAPEVELEEAEISSDATTEIEGEVQVRNEGSASFGGSASIEGSGRLSSSGDLSGTGSGEITLEDASMTAKGEGSVHGEGSVTARGDSTVEIRGEVEARAGEPVTVEGGDAVLEEGVYEASSSRSTAEGETLEPGTAGSEGAAPQAEGGGSEGASAGAGKGTTDGGAAPQAESPPALSDAPGTNPTREPLAEGGGGGESSPLQNADPVLGPTGVALEPEEAARIQAKLDALPPDRRQALLDRLGARTEGEQASTAQDILDAIDEEVARASQPPEPTAPEAAVPEEELVEEPAARVPEQAEPEHAEPEQAEPPAKKPELEHEGLLQIDPHTVVEWSAAEGAYHWRGGEPIGEVLSLSDGRNATILEATLDQHRLKGAEQEVSVRLSFTLEVEGKRLRESVRFSLPAGSGTSFTPIIQDGLAERALEKRLEPVGEVLRLRPKVGSLLFQWHGLWVRVQELRSSRYLGDGIYEVDLVLEIVKIDRPDGLRLIDEVTKELIDIHAVGPDRSTPHPSTIGFHFTLKFDAPEGAP